MQFVHAKRGFLILLACFAGFLIFNGLHLKYYVRTGPGPGFFPIWIGGLLALGAMSLLVKSYFDDADGENFFQSQEAALGVIWVVAALVITWFGLKYLGFRLAILFFCLIVPRVFGTQPIVTTIAVAVFASFGVAYAFEKWLGVFLPEPAFEMLKILGL